MVLEKLYPPQTSSSFDAYKAEHAVSIADPNTYWKSQSSLLTWFTPFTNVSAGSFENGDIRWFENGKLNACFNCVDRHIQAGKGEKIAIIWEGDNPADVKKISYNSLLANVSKIANVLIANGVKKGDVLTIYMPMVPSLMYTMLACARIGAVHSVIFAGFSADAIAERIIASKSKWVVTSNAGVRGGKMLKLKDIVDQAINRDECLSVVEKCFVFTRVEDYNVAMKEGRDVDMDLLVKGARPYCPCEVMDSEDPLFILYTSGSTGRPKGLLHTTAGYLLYAQLTTKNSFGLKDGDIYACVADAGWITGHSYIVYGPLLNCTTTFMFESTPMYPDHGRYWDCVERHKINIFYTAPTAIRSLMRFGDEIVSKYDLSSLRVLGTVGEPINPEAWRWYYEVIGQSKCSIVDTFWQTETGGHVVTNLPGITPMKPGSCTLPCYGIDAVVLDPVTGQELSGECSGVLAIKQPWPSITRTCLEDHERYLTVYMKPYPGYYFPGDGCLRDSDGYIWITGRVDDVLNVSGHRIGTAEVESALVAHNSVSQAAAVGFPHDIKGSGIACFVTLTVGFSQSPSLLTQLKSCVRSAIGPFATPDMIVVSSSLPMTRSGKIMRRILRKIAAGEIDSLGDTSTLADPSVVEMLIEKVEEVRGGM